MVFYFINDDFNLVIACFAIFISLSVSMRSYAIENDKMFKDLFESYNKKYDDRFNDELNEINDAIQIEADSYKYKLVVDYLNFCSEQYLWYKKNRIPKDVWLCWKSGMQFHFNKKSIKKIIEQEKVQKDSYYGLFEYLEL